MKKSQQKDNTHNIDQLDSDSDDDDNQTHIPRTTRSKPQLSSRGKQSNMKLHFCCTEVKPTEQESASQYLRAFRRWKGNRVVLGPKKATEKADDFRAALLMEGMTYDEWMEENHVTR